LDFFLIEGHGSHGSQRGISANGIGLHGSENNTGELKHGHSRFRENLVKFGGQNDWGEVIGKVAKVK